MHDTNEYQSRGRGDEDRCSASQSADGHVNGKGKLHSHILEAAGVLGSSMQDAWAGSQKMEHRMSLSIAKTMSSIQRESNIHRSNEILQLASRKLARSWPVHYMLQHAASGEEGKAFVQAACDYVSESMKNSITFGELVSKPGNVVLMINIL